jgi:hypothetical protein
LLLSWTQHRISLSHFAVFSDNVQKFHKRWGTCLQVPIKTQY